MASVRLVLIVTQEFLAFFLTIMLLFLSQNTIGKLGDRAYGKKFRVV